MLSMIRSLCRDQIILLGLIYNTLTWTYKPSHWSNNNKGRPRGITRLILDELKLEMGGDNVLIVGYSNLWILNSINGIVEDCVTRMN